MESKYLQCVLAVGALVLARPSQAQDAASQPAEASPAPPAIAAPAPPPAIPALTPVQIEILATINSSINKIGEHFPIRLTAPIALPGGGEVPAGTMGQGDVVHAAKSRFGGKPGELILAVRWLDWNGTHVPLRSLRYLPPTTGKNNQGTAEAFNLAGSVAPGASIIALFITGGEVIIPEGTLAQAKTSAAVPIPVAAPVQEEQPEAERKPD